MLWSLRPRQQSLQYFFPAISYEKGNYLVSQYSPRTMVGTSFLVFFFFLFSLISLIADGPHHSSCLWSQRIIPSLPGSRSYIFLSRCKFSTLITRQPMVEFYFLTFPRFPLRKKEHKSYFGKNRTHDFRTSRCAGYLLDHSGDEGFTMRNSSNFDANQEGLKCCTQSSSQSADLLGRSDYCTRSRRAVTIIPSPSPTPATNN